MTAGLALALAIVSSASPRTGTGGIAKGVPNALHAFVLRADEPVIPAREGRHGTWYCRVRGVNPNLPANAQKMTWSPPVASPSPAPSSPLLG